MYSNNRQDLKSRQTLQQPMHVISVVEYSLFFYPLHGFLPKQLINKNASRTFCLHCFFVYFFRFVVQLCPATCGVAWVTGSQLKIISWYSLQIISLLFPYSVCFNQWSKLYAKKNQFEEENKSIWQPCMTAHLWARKEELLPYRKPFFLPPVWWE